MEDKKSLDGWEIDLRGCISKGIYTIQHGTSSFCHETQWSRIITPRVMNDISGDDAFYKNVMEVERRFSTEEDVVINGYHLYLVEDDAIYAAKSQHDVLQYVKNNYGTIKDVYDKDESDFFSLLTHINLCESFVHLTRVFHNDETGGRERRSYYDYYKEVATKNDGCFPVIFFNV